MSDSAVTLHQWHAVPGISSSKAPARQLRGAQCSPDGTVLVLGFSL